ncbi:MAG: peptidoglycan DD-metalloendopeptidase family protein [Bacteroidia bacterium]|nr:peptidoglycan DD-metalloendopeptidase family protein [Bacteroidia bacterium]NND11134.1 peptidoglycan DD-metalloendopeptidase family protein [Flavobacteriaceae bacterium]NNK28187.1 peptidoglycan DD-metalloendopeptidase family protein [Flavobacteriaceae bacterium]
MTKHNSIVAIVLAVFFLAAIPSSFAQVSKKEKLEQRKQEILRELKELNTLLFSDKKKQKTELSAIEDLNYKLSVRKNLIKITNQQANLLTREINTNQNIISELRDELKQLKEDYAAMVVKSYKSKSEQSRVMFLMSSTNFQQAYKRLDYIKQYAKYQKQQGEEIKAKTLKLQEVNTKLLAQKKDKERLIAENRIAKKELEAEVKQHENLMKSIRKNLSKYASQIKTKQREADRIDRQIERLIREAMASSNTRAGRSASSSTFAMTPENIALSKNFTSNKGKLPWPLERGVKRMGYGTQPHPVVKTAKIQSNGIRIETNKGAKVRAVFDGTVLDIMRLKGIPPIVVIQHGNYSTVYKNVSKVFVQKGDKVTTNQEIGEVFTNNSGKTILSFSVFKDGKTQNPDYWIAKR